VVLERSGIAEKWKGRIQVWRLWLRQYKRPLPIPVALAVRAASLALWTALRMLIV